MEALEKYNVWSEKSEYAEKRRADKYISYDTQKTNKKVTSKGVSSCSCSSCSCSS